MIITAETCGFCAGAQKAFEGALTAINENPGKRVVLFKRLLHNQDVITALESKKIITINNKEEFKQGDVIVIRAHGETREMMKHLKDSGFVCKDCTCQKINHIHKLIEGKYNNGYKIFIIGDKDHPEVISSNSWCDNNAVIISSAEDVEQANNLTNERISVIAQTTFNSEIFFALSEQIKRKFASCNVEILNTLCNLTEKIQNTSVKLAAQCKTMIVIGGKDSANTRELCNKCEKVCHDIRRVDAKKHFRDMIINGDFDFNSGIGITGGASTPTEIIRECKQLLLFKKFYQETREKIAGKIKEYDQILLQNNDLLFQSAVEQFAAIGESKKAKFIRGSLLMLGYRMAQRQNEDYSLDLAAAYELFETSILVHDDVFDKAGQRRDVTTVHEKIRKKYLAGHEDKEELIAFNAQSIAVCIGDLGFYFLYQMILNAYKNDKNLVSVLQYFNDIVIKTIKGELMDIALPLEEQLNVPHTGSLEDYVLQIDTLKTARYTTIGPFCLGLTLGGVKQHDLEKFEKLFLYLGIAFQIQDDCLNIYGEAEQGKPIGNDISEFKMTLLYSEACKNEEWKNELLKYYGKDDLSPKAVEAVKNIFEKTGAKEKAYRVMTEYLEKCRALLADMTFKSEEDRDILLGFILFLELRSR
jgi:(E)-4-hydroxy-3-methyl-but-2-enyl pyrophosphate reductase